MTDMNSNGGIIPRKPAASTILLGGEDAMEEDEVVMTPSVAPASGAVAIPMIVADDTLISKIITPSPFPHHTTGATSARFRNALGRVTTDPTSDVEAWQALITEATTCYRSMLGSGVIHQVDADTHSKLDWIESCFGTLLHYFPYASSYHVQMAEMLLAQSARVGEDDGPKVDYGMDPSHRSATCEAKADRIFRDVLGIQMDGSKNPSLVLGGMCTSSVQLWLLYVRKRTRDATRHARTIPPDEGPKLIREWTIRAYDRALEDCSFVVNNHLIWKQYVAWVKSWVPATAGNMMMSDHLLAKQQMEQLRSVFQRLVTHPMTGLDQLYQEYDAFERSQSEALAQALLEEYGQKYRHARNVYLERNKIYRPEDLQLERLATPPVDGSSVNDSGEGEEDYESKRKDEYELLQVWKKRCSYERTDPERLGDGTDALAHRVRQGYKEMACAMTLYPEVWYMWSRWELTLEGSDQGGSGGVGKTTNGAGGAIDRARAVLQLGQGHIPDCTLLAYAEAQIVELHNNKTSATVAASADGCMQVMEAFLDRTPNTLAFILYQQMVRRHKGKKEARAVFAKARRILLDPDSKKETGAVSTAAATDAMEQDGGGADDDGAAGDKLAGNNTAGNQRRTVTNRLDADVGLGKAPETEDTPENDVDDNNNNNNESSAVKPGPITWQLYAAHATMEHRVNQSKDIAARIYELGLRKHASFLTKTPYVIKYANLLLELNDRENLRSLLTRAVAASGGQGNDQALWDATLNFEWILSASDPNHMRALHKAEERRHAALFGPDMEDVATGGLIAAGDMTPSTKSTVSEQLIRNEGYDVSSGIISGMSRTSDVLELMGLWGSGDAVASSLRGAIDKNDGWDAGGKSDASFQRRQRYKSNLLAATQPTTGVQQKSGRDRLHQAGAGAGAGQQQTAMAMAIQQSPEWLRSLLLQLPASRYRSPIVPKPPAHMVELALTSLQNNALPAERPKASGSNGAKRKRDDDSDEEDDMFGGGGYSDQFRARQRARQTATQD